MQIIVKDGRVSAIAESRKDIEALLALDKGLVKRVQARTARKQVKYKTNCPVPGCTKRVKHTKLHVRRNHPLWEAEQRANSR